MRPLRPLAPGLAQLPSVRSVCPTMIATDAASMESFPSVLIGSSALEVAGALLAAAALPLSPSQWSRLAAYVYQQQYVLSLRARRYESTKTKSRTVPRGDPAFLPPKNWWRIEELEEYDGSGDVDGPILLAVDGLVFNVAKARDFYGPGGEYAVMGGKDASRYLAKNTVEPETQKKRPSPSTWLRKLHWLHGNSHSSKSTTS